MSDELLARVEQAELREAAALRQTHVADAAYDRIRARMDAAVAERDAAVAANAAILAELRALIVRCGGSAA